jgi:hypothetical protein
MFFIARVTSLNVDVDAGEETLWGVSVAWQKFFNTGLLGAIITTIVASIAWQLVASAFLSPSCPTLLPTSSSASVSGSYWYLLWAWVLAWVNKTIAGYQRDEVYIGTAEERAAKDHADDDEQLHMGPGHPRKAPGFTENVPALQRLMKSDASVKAYLASMKAMDGTVVTRCKVGQNAWQKLRSDSDQKL